MFRRCEEGNLPGAVCTRTLDTGKTSFQLTLMFAFDGLPYPVQPCLDTGMHHQLEDFQNLRQQTMYKIRTEV